VKGLEPIDIGEHGEHGEHRAHAEHEEREERGAHEPRAGSPHRMAGLVLGPSTRASLADASTPEPHARERSIDAIALLAELGVPTDRPADLELRVAPVDAPKAWSFERRLEGADEPWLRVARPPGFVVLRVEGACDASLDLSRRELVIEPAPGVSLGVVAHAITDRLLPQLAGLFGRVSLHGSAVARRIDGRFRALCFVGSSGAGKSTLAASFVRRGAVLLADDTIVLACPRRPGERALVMPSSHSSRLHDDSLEALRLTPAERGGAEEPAQKGRVRHASALSEPVPVEVMFVLEDSGTLGELGSHPPHEPRAPHSLARLTPREALAALTEHLDRLDLADRSMLEGELDRLVTLARDVPVARLRHERSFARLEALVAALEAFAATSARWSR
jgi:hypothetical protein